VRELDDGFFDYGPNRRAHEAVWTKARYAALCERLESVAVGWRFFLKHQMFDRLAARVARNEAPPGAEIIATLFDELVAEYPALTAQRKALELTA
jgi:N-methylhydantoinase B